MADQAGIEDDLRRLRDAPPELDHLPVTIISGQKVGRLDRRQREPLTAAHQTSAARLARGRHVWATRSGHLVPFTEPQVVADEVLRIVDSLAG